MADELHGWEVISEQVNAHTFGEMVLGFAGGMRPPPTTTFTLREKSTGITKTITAFGAGELPERIASGKFDHAPVISEDEAELIRAGLGSGGEARNLALSHLEHIFRERLQRGDIDAAELFGNLRDFLRQSGEEPVREFTERCLRLLPERAQSAIVAGDAPASAGDRQSD